MLRPWMGACVRRQGSAGTGQRRSGPRALAHGTRCHPSLTVLHTRRITPRASTLACSGLTCCDGKRAYPVPPSPAHPPPRPFPRLSPLCPLLLPLPLPLPRRCSSSSRRSAPPPTHCSVLRPGRWWCWVRSSSPTTSSRLRWQGRGRAASSRRRSRSRSPGRGQSRRGLPG